MNGITFQHFVGSLAAFVGFVADVAPGEITSGRARALVGAGAGLISVILGGLAFARAAGRIGSGNGRVMAICALVAGVIAAGLSAMHLAGGTGGLGTGGGRLGAMAGLVLGLIGAVLGGATLAKTRRSE